MSSTTSSSGSAAAATSTFLDSYEPLDVIGNGSFGIIRKVRRKSDGLVFARKELNFERMSERDRKQIVSEVNILKDLHHDHIVRYHDRFVDRDAGILYILMEYCGGGDLSTVIKHAAKAGRAIPEDTIWHYFHQILHTLQHCHHPNSHGRSASGGGSPAETQGAVMGNGGGQGRRAQILHRDLKPDNVFLDENNTVKLGDFGLSKALAQASFANTYVGTPYYMSPELMQEKAYDSKSDIWSLGCLIYELCALKPPFHDGKTHSELSIFIRNGRIPPLPRGYSQALTSVIKSMLNLNPAMRPSAAQLLQHERLELVSRVAEAEKMPATVKSHRAIVAAKERKVLAREHSLLETQQHLTVVITQKDREIAALQQLISQLQQQSSSSSSQSQTYTRAEVEHAVNHAVSVREEELRALVMQRETEVAQAIAQREEEIMKAVRAREVEVDNACRVREEAVRNEAEVWMREFEERRVEVEDRANSVEEREQAIEEEERRLKDIEEGLRREEAVVVVTATGRSAAGVAKGRKEKNPLEEVKNVLDPSARMVQAAPPQPRRARTINNPVTSTNTTSTGTTTAPSATTTKPESQPTPRPNPAITHSMHSLATPIARSIHTSNAAHIPGPTNVPFSAMKGVVLTATGETLAAPSPAELVSLFERSPKVGLNFGRIFDFGAADKAAAANLNLNLGLAGALGEGDSAPPCPSVRKERGREGKEKEIEADERDEGVSSTSSGSGSTGTQQSQQQQTVAHPNRRSTMRQQQLAVPPPTRIRRPSIRSKNSSGANGGSNNTSGGARPAHSKSGSSGSVPSSCSNPAGLCSTGSASHSVTCGLASRSTGGTSSSSHSHQQPKPLPHPHLRPSSSATDLCSAALGQSSSSSSTASSSVGVAFPLSVPVLPIPVPRTHPLPEYDFADEENLPSPFLKKVDKNAMAKAKAVAAAAAAPSSGGINPGLALAAESTAAPGSGASSSGNGTSSSSRTERRGTSGLLLRAVAAANNAGRRNGVGAVPEGAGEHDNSYTVGYSPQGDVAAGGFGTVASGDESSGGSGSTDNARPSLASARKASEEARKALLRP